jgi:hypothetical protein
MPPPPLTAHEAPVAQDVQLAPPAPQLVAISPPAQACALLQQPAQPLPVLQTHCPAMHFVPAPHGLPQVPQFALSVCRLTQEFVAVHRFGVEPEQDTPHAFALQTAVPVPAPGPAHTPQALPAAPLPQTEGDCPVVTQPLLLQQPPAHEAALHATHEPL